MLIREAISEIKNDLSVLNQDEWLSNRHIYHKLKKYASMYIKQDDIRKIYKQGKLFTAISCVEMETVPLSSCCNVYIPTCKTVQRSINKIPKPYTTGRGEVLQVFDIEYGKFTQISPQGYKSVIDDNEFVTANDKYFWYEDEHIHIPNSSVTIVSVKGMFEDVDTVTKATSACKEHTVTNCKSMLDEEFSCPSYLQAAVIKAVIADLAPLKKQMPSDNTPDLNTNSK